MKLNYSHEAMVDLIIQEPTVTQSELATIFGYSEGWVSRVLNSDSFQARLADRKQQLVDPAIKATLDERLRGVAIKSISILDEKLSSADAGAQMALDALGIATVAMNKPVKVGK